MRLKTLTGKDRNIRREPHPAASLVTANPNFHDEKHNKTIVKKVSYTSHAFIPGDADITHKYRLLTRVTSNRDRRFPFWSYFIRTDRLRNFNCGSAELLTYLRR